MMYIIFCSKDSLGPTRPTYLNSCPEPLQELLSFIVFVSVRGNLRGAPKAIHRLKIDRDLKLTATILNNCGNTLHPLHHLLLRVFLWL